MALIDTNALREYFKINEHCEECHWNSRDCSMPPYYSLRDICAAIDEIPTIHAIPVEWVKKKIIGATKDLGAVIHDGVLKELLFDWQKEQEAR